MGELATWIEDREDSTVFYGPRDDGETPRRAFEDLRATYGDDDWEMHRTEHIWLVHIDGDQALDFFDGEYESGWVICRKGTDGAIPAWEIEVTL